MTIYLECMFFLVDGLNIICIVIFVILISFGRKELLVMHLVCNEAFCRFDPGCVHQFCSLYGRLAQRLAQRIYTAKVHGSNPWFPTIFWSNYQRSPLHSIIRGALFCIIRVAPSWCRIRYKRHKILT